MMGDYYVAPGGWFSKPRYFKKDKVKKAFDPTNYGCSSGAWPEMFTIETDDGEIVSVFDPDNDTTSTSW